MMDTNSWHKIRGQLTFFIVLLCDSQNGKITSFNFLKVSLEANNTIETNSFVML